MVVEGEHTRDIMGVENLVLNNRLRIRVADFLADYTHCIDDNRLEEWPDYFAERGLYHITTKENYEAGFPIGLMYCEGRGMLNDRIKALRTANVFEPHTYCHFLGGSRLSYKGKNILSARTNFSVWRTMETGKTESFAIGKYLDEIRFDDRELEFTSRRVILESRRVDVLLVIPI